MYITLDKIGIKSKQNQDKIKIKSRWKDMDGPLRSLSFLRNFVQKTIFFMSYFSHENLHTNEVNLYKKKLKKKGKTVGKGGKSHITWTGKTKIIMYLPKIWRQMRMSSMFFGPRLFARKPLNWKYQGVIIFYTVKPNNIF